MSTPILATILSTGTELTLGELADTNGPWLAKQLSSLGFEVTNLRQIGDDSPALISALQEAKGKFGVLILTGGLGPTTDDLTAEAFSTAFNRPLELHENQLEKMKAIFSFLNRPFPEINAKQAYLPAGCTVLENNNGTAPGWLLEESGTAYAALPGVPGEMKPMFDDCVKPLLLKRFDVHPPERVLLQTIGIPESRLQERITPLQQRHPDVFVRFAAHWHGVEVKLGWVPGKEREPGALAEVVQEARLLLEDAIFSEDGSPMEVVIGKLLREQGATLATAESFTGGKVAQLITSIPGSSDYFDRGFVTYSNASKREQLDVSDDLITEHGAVSEEVALAMASGVCRVARTTYGLATTGIAGPGGATDTKPVGLGYIAVSGPNGTTCKRVKLPGNREQVQARASATALMVLWKMLIKNE